MKFKNIGNHTVAGVAPGGTVDIDDDVQAAQLVAGGHLAPSRKPAKTTEAAPVEVDES